MDIKIEPKLITPRVKDHRGYTDMIFDLTLFLECVDTETGSTLGYQIFKEFDTEFEYTRKNSFTPFDQITKEQIETLTNNLIEEERVGGQITLIEWAEKRFAEIYSEPTPKCFSFELFKKDENIDAVGIGSSAQ